ncbi:MAG: hypothetical protein PHV42_01205 [Candidatus Pacebacteria bacterium]|nr:hypothetical protein [Candidatus Paceibacterota bacterium]
MILVALVSVSIISVEGWCAYQDGWFTPLQMLQGGTSEGIPLMAHEAVFWGDLLIITPVLVIIVGLYSSSWSSREVIAIIPGGALISAVMHAIWERSDLSDALFVHHRMTEAGHLHLIYMWWTIVILLEFYFYTPKVKKYHLIAISSLLAFHVFLGSHIILASCNFAWYQERPWTNPMTWVVILVAWSVIFYRSRRIRTY